MNKILCCPFFEDKLYGQPRINYTYILKLVIKIISFSATIVPMDMPAVPENQKGKHKAR